MAHRRRVRSVGARQPCATARTCAREVSYSPLPRHHAQSAVSVPRARLGLGLLHHRSPRAHQPASNGTSPHLPIHAAAHRRFHHLLRRLQRRREQSRLERVGLGSRRGRAVAASNPSLHKTDSVLPGARLQEMSLRGIERTGRTPVLAASTMVFVYRPPPSATIWAISHDNLIS